jgi:hypothetical protein
MLKPIFTTWVRLAAGVRVWQGAAMDSRAPQAGGCLLFLCIVAGGWWGLQSGLTGRGLIIGTAAGVVLALALWLIDRLRRER